MSSAQQSRQLSEPQHIAHYSRNQENRDSRSVRLHCHQRLPWSGPVLLHKKRRETGDRRRVKQRGKRKLSAVDLFNEIEQLSRFERMAAEIEKIVVKPDLVDPEHLLPQDRHLYIHAIAWCNIYSATRESG